jgi:hypothetical protein
MQRIRIVGLSLVAMFAFCAVVASAAQAGELGHCVKDVKETLTYETKNLKGVFTHTRLTNDGLYANTNCTTPAPPGKFVNEGPPKVIKPCFEAADAKPDADSSSECPVEYNGPEGTYNWEAAAPVKYTDTSKTVTLGWKGLERAIVCEKGTSTGEWTGWQTNVDRLTFKGCTSAEGRCNSVAWGGGGWFPSEAPGTISTLGLSTFLIDHGTAGPGGLEPKNGEVWNEYEQKTETALSGHEIGTEKPKYLWALIQCGGKAVYRISGTLSGVIASANLMTSTFVTTFAGSREVGGEKEQGEQDLVVEDINPPSIPEWVSVGPSDLKALVLTKNAAKVEIRACNEPLCEHEEPLPW